MRINTGVGLGVKANDWGGETRLRKGVAKPPRGTGFFSSPVQGDLTMLAN